MIHGIKTNTDQTYCTRSPYDECQNCKHKKPVAEHGPLWYMNPPRLEQGKCPMKEEK